MPLSLPKTLTAGTPENVNDVMADLTYLATQVDATNTNVANNTPSGVLYPYAGGSAPTGFLLCDGSAVSRTTYAALFTAISTSYGAGDGSTTFNVPDMQGRAPFGKGTNADVNALGANDGRTLSARKSQHQHTTGSHTHTVPDHSHTFSGTTGDDNASYVGGGSITPGNPVSAHTHQHPFSGATNTVSGVTSGGTSLLSDLNGPAYLVVNYIIKT